MSDSGRGIPLTVRGGMSFSPSRGAIKAFQPNTGDRYVGPHPERDLPRIPHHRTSRHRPSRGKAMTEAVMALSVFFSISIFLAHAFDAYRMR